MAKVKKPEIEGNIVADYYDGATRIKISDAYYRDRTPEDVQRTIRRMTEIAWNIVLHERAMGRTDI